jgi:hypothetical protein
VAFTTMSVPSGMRWAPSHTTRSASVEVPSASSATSSAPRASLRLTMVIRAAPASAVSTAIARAAPPAPKTTTVAPDGSATVRSAVTKPWPSVFSPIQRPSRRTTQLTAPISAADSPSPSRCSTTATLWGREQLKPIQPIARAPRTASPNPSGATSQLR